MDAPVYPPPSHELSNKRQKLASETEKAFRAFSKQVFADGALNGKTKQIISVAVAHVTQCPYCIRGHTEAALRAGARPEELMEAIWVAVHSPPGARRCLPHCGRLAAARPMDHHAAEVRRGIARRASRTAEPPGDSALGEHGHHGARVASRRRCAPPPPRAARRARATAEAARAGAARSRYPAPPAPGTRADCRPGARRERWTVASLATALEDALATRDRAAALALVDDLRCLVLRRLC